MIEVTIENAHDGVCVELVREVSIELGTLYNTDGSGKFTLDDVTIPRSAFVVAWLDGEAVGCGALRPMPDQTVGEIKRMYVRPAARGRGISRKILTKLESLAVEFEYRALQLETGVLQPEAIGLYETSGFVRMGCYDDYASDPRSICYEKQL